jgi:hypothetical protein
MFCVELKNQLIINLFTEKDNNKKIYKIECDLYIKYINKCQ